MYFLHQQLRPQIRKLRQMLLQVDVIILHENAQPHHKDSVLSVFDGYGWETLAH